MLVLTFIEASVATIDFLLPDKGKKQTYINQAGGVK